MWLAPLSTQCSTNEGKSGRRIIPLCTARQFPQLWRSLSFRSTAAALFPNYGMPAPLHKSDRCWLTVWPNVIHRVVNRPDLLTVQRIQPSITHRVSHITLLLSPSNAQSPVLVTVWPITPTAYIWMGMTNKTWSRMRCQPLQSTPLDIAVNSWSRQS
jgi:hypothetical protein